MLTLISLSNFIVRIFVETNFINLLQLRFPLTRLMPVVLFYTPWNHQKTRVFLMFSGIMEKDQWHQMRLNSEIGRSPQGLTTRKF